MWLWVNLALADVVGPPAENCPDGAQGSSSHAGPFCAPLACDPGSCEYPCTDLGLCVVDHVGATPTGGTYDWQEAVDDCASQADCPAEATCVIEPRCVDPDDLDDGEEAAGCRCGSVPLGPASLVAGAVLLQLWWNRRRRGGGVG